MARVSRNNAHRGLEYYAVGGAVGTSAITDSSSNITGLGADRAFTMMTLLSVTSGSVFWAYGATAEAGEGTPFVLGVPVKVFGTASIKAICGTGAATAVVSSQVFSLGRDLNSGADLT